MRFRYLANFWCGIAVFSRYHVRYSGIRTPLTPPSFKYPRGGGNSRSPFYSSVRSERVDCIANVFYIWTMLTGFKELAGEFKPIAIRKRRNMLNEKFGKVICLYTRVKDSVRTKTAKCTNSPDWSPYISLKNESRELPIKAFSLSQPFSSIIHFYSLLRR